MNNTVAVKEIVTNGNVRTAAKASDALIASIERFGIIQPLVVKPADGGYELIAGHRRLDAALALGLSDVPVHVVGFGDTITETDRIGMQVAENVHREDLNAWELAQAAWDLKLEGLNQGEVSATLSIDKKDISRMQKVAKELLKDDVLEAGQLGVFSIDGLEHLADTDALPSDVLALIDERTNLNQAAAAAVSDRVQAEFLVAIRDDLEQWSHTGVEVTYEDPLFKKATNGNTVKDNNVAVLGSGYQELDISIAKHAKLDCHTVWVKIPDQYSYGDPRVIHLCTKVKTHYTDKAEVPAKDAETVRNDKTASSADRAKQKNAKEMRRLVAAAFVESKTEVKVLRELAMLQAVESVHYNDWGVFVRILELDKPKGEHAENTVKRWLKEQKDPDVALLKLILVARYYDMGRSYSKAGEWVQKEVLPGLEGKINNGEQHPS